jgi:hypothetical protein
MRLFFLDFIRSVFVNKFFFFLLILPTVKKGGAFQAEEKKNVQKHQKQTKQSKKFSTYFINSKNFFH